ncbi:hypothetical protein PGB90_005710 [Kerria lacca]
MLSIHYNRHHHLMAADETFSEKPKNIYKLKNTSVNMRNTDMISIGKMLDYDIVPVKVETESADEEDEISVGCPSPIARAKNENEDSMHNDRERIQHEDDDDDDKKQSLRHRSSSFSSDSSLHGRHSSDSFVYLRKLEKSDDNHMSDINERYSSSDDEERQKNEPEEYFKPLKRLKMVKIDKTSFSISERTKNNLNKRLSRQNNHKVSNFISQVEEKTDDNNCNQKGVKSFSICDILSHKPNKNSSASSSKIVRPWDSEPQEEPTNPYLIPPPAHRGILPQHPLFLSQFHPQQIALHLHRVKSEDMSSAYESCSSSGRSSTNGSDCCTSPDVLNCSVQNTSISITQHQSHKSRNSGQIQRSKSANGKSNSSPLDALFQMTNKTFDELNGDPNSGKMIKFLLYIFVIFDTKLLFIKRCSCKI